VPVSLRDFADPVKRKEWAQDRAGIARLQRIQDRLRDERADRNPTGAKAGDPERDPSDP